MDKDWPWQVLLAEIRKLCFWLHNFTLAPGKPSDNRSWHRQSSPHAIKLRTNPKVELRNSKEIFSDDLIILSN